MYANLVLSYLYKDSLCGSIICALDSLLITVFLLINPASASSPKLSFCTDDGWVPYTFKGDNNEASGIHIETALKAMENLNIEASVVPLPWKRCLNLARNGEYDGVVSASYKKERAQFLIYPPDAAIQSNSQWDLGKVEYVLITRHDDTYGFDGNIQSLPQPVGVGLGSSTASYIKDEGLETVESEHHDSLVEMLLLKRVNSIAMHTIRAKKYLGDDRYAAKIKVSNKAIRSKPYFLVFTHGGQTNELLRMSIWDSLQDVLADKEYIFQLFKKYD